MPVVWKEETVVFVRGRVRVERTALGIAGGQNKVVEAVQDEASPTTPPVFSSSFAEFLDFCLPELGVELRARFEL